MINGDVIDFYQNILDELSIDNVKIRSIHDNKNICFNSNVREILHAIKKSIKNSNDEPCLYFKETIFGKAIVVSIKTLSSKNDLNNLIIYFIKYYYDRLKIIENYFNNEGIYFNDLIEKKERLLCKYNIIINLNLSDKITSKILSYLDFNYQDFMKLRDIYESRKVK